MLVAASGWWIGSIIFLIIWVAIAFWSTSRRTQGPQFHPLLPVQPGLLPGRADRRLPRSGSTPLTAFTTTRTTDCRLACTSDPGPATATASGGRGVGGGETPLARVERPGQL